jgi:hypothetical protein
MTPQSQSRRLLPVTTLLGALLMASCALQTTSASNSVLGWPFDTSSGSWTIENGYNTGPDHTGYELDSFDFQHSGGTMGQTVLSPAARTSVDFGPAYPYDGSSGECVSISINGQSGYHLMVCHLTDPQTGAVTQGQTLGTVHGGTYGDHIHITLYYLDPSVPDVKANASQRHAQDFSGAWSIAGCPYPASGKADEWAGTAVPCSSSGTTAQSTPNVAGTWQWAGPSLAGGGEHVVSCNLQLQQSGAMITGDPVCTGEYYQDICDISGSLSGHQISFQGKLCGMDVYPSDVHHYQFTGSVNNAATEMHGTYTLIEQVNGYSNNSQGTWSATR